MENRNDFIHSFLFFVIKFSNQEIEQVISGILADYEDKCERMSRLNKPMLLTKLEFIYALSLYIFDRKLDFLGNLSTPSEDAKKIISQACVAIIIPLLSTVVMFIALTIMEKNFKNDFMNDPVNEKLGFPYSADPVKNYNNAT